MPLQPNRMPAILACLALAAACAGAVAALSAQTARPPSRTVIWPDGARGALSLSFDDARASHLDIGVPLFAELGTRVTFYLTASNVAQRAEAWRRAAAAGHEMGNHTVHHPCSGNFPWSRERALETFTLERMRQELVEANGIIEAATGQAPRTYAYTCGHTFVGHGAGTTSYVPLVSELFLAGRGWQGETSNDPAFVDLAQVLGYPMDDVDFTALKPVVDEAVEQGRWLVLAGHDIGETPGRQVTRVSMLRELIAYVKASEREVWVDTVERVAERVKGSSGAISSAGPPPSSP